MILFDLAAIVALCSTFLDPITSTLLWRLWSWLKDFDLDLGTSILAQYSFLRQQHPTTTTSTYSCSSSSNTQPLVVASTRELQSFNLGHEGEREMHQNFDFPFFFHLDQTRTSLALFLHFALFLASRKISNFLEIFCSKWIRTTSFIAFMWGWIALLKADLVWRQHFSFFTQY